MDIFEGVEIEFDDDGDETGMAPYAGIQEFVVLALVKDDNKAPKNLENILSVYKSEKESSGKSSPLFDKEIVVRDVKINDELIYESDYQ